MTIVTYQQFKKFSKKKLFMSLFQRFNYMAITQKFSKKKFNRTYFSDLKIQRKRGNPLSFGGKG
jgi:dimeric dUTPase (all-alpha-NTP-PPase superfamily)